MIRSALVRQFSHPRGALGRLAGKVMATRRTNVDRNRWIVEVLDPAPDARICEIGHGPGIAIEAIWPRLTTGKVTGVEISELMHQTASRRNRAGIEAGRVELRVGDSQALAPELTDLDLVLGVNTAMFWDDPRATVADLASRLADGGELVLVYMQPPGSMTTAAEMEREIGAHLVTAGLDVTSTTMPGEQPAVAVRGRRAA